MKNIQQGRQNFILRVQKSSFLRIIFYGNFLVFKFLSVDWNCFPLLAGFFIRVLESLSYVFRGKNGETFSSMEFFSKFLAVWAIFLIFDIIHCYWFC